MRIGLGGLAGRKLNDLDLGGIHAVLLQDHLEQIDIGLGAADDADAAPGELRNFGDLRAGLLALGLAGRGTQSTATFLRSVATAWAFSGTLEIAADDGEVGLAVGQRLQRSRRRRRSGIGRRRIWLCVCAKAWVSA